MKEKLNLYQVNNQVLNDAIDKIVVKFHSMNKSEGVKTFLFTGVGANCGTTTVGLNIAISLAEAGWKTVFVDCDLRKEQKYKRIGKEATNTLAKYLSGECSRGEEIINNTSVDNLDYIVAGDKNDKAVRLLCNVNMEKLLSSLKETYDFVIVDTPSISVAKDAEILIPNMDKYLFVSCMNMSTKKQLFDVRLELSDYENKYAGIIINNLEMMQYKSIIKDYNHFSDKEMTMKLQSAMEKKGNE